ncbi:MAG: 50S ribosomal protein L6 [Nanoarchaeota archaeon]
MKKEIIESADIPEGTTCRFSDSILFCKKDSLELSKKFKLPKVEIEVKGSKIILSSKKGSKKEFKMIKSAIAHIKNIFKGLKNKFTYHLEACNLHFPMILKVEKDELVINNFLGEKVPRRAKIRPKVEIDVKGYKITLTSNDREAAGQTAANIEKATKISYRDRRIFQDGIFITEKPEDK